MTGNKQQLLSANSQAYTRFRELLHKRGTSEDISEKLGEQVLYDLEDIYIQARTTGNIGAAIKAKELQGKELGLFIKEKRSQNKGIPMKPLDQLNLEDLEYLINSSCEELGLNPQKMISE